MKKLIIPILITIFSMQFIAFAENIPSSHRAYEVIGRIQPKIQKEFEKLNLILGSPIYMRIFKQEKELEIWVENENKFNLFKKYPICTYGN